FAAESVPITVYTHKKNHPVQLPRGACVLDFAFRLFGKRALAAVSAGVNGHKGMPLSHVLKDGDIVHVDSDPKSKPGLEWLEWVRTPEAADGVKGYYASLGEESLLAGAMAYLSGKLEKYHLSAAELLDSDFFGKLLARQDLRGPAEFLQKLGRGEVKNTEKLLAEAMKELQAQFADPQAPRLKQPFLIIAESRQGLLDKIANPMKDIANISVGFFHEYDDNGKKMAAMTIYVECADSPAGRLQLRRIRNIIDKTPGVTKCTSDQSQIDTSVHYFVEYIKKGS
ncbi:MAG: TGS domain-containing protein, partial [Candidatus Margulisbacteria bacterium]|nr:TGS domain-containing protein [Candidatus Margulisiibacteriota bacterium]